MFERHDTSCVKWPNQSLCLFPSLCDENSNVYLLGLSEGTNEIVGAEKLCVLPSVEQKMIANINNTYQVPGSGLSSFCLFTLVILTITE